MKTLPETALAPGAWICLLEDDVAVLGAMRRLVEHWGCRVVEGADAAQALDDWHRSGCPRPSAIVADLQLRRGGRVGRRAPSEGRLWHAGIRRRSW